MLNITAPAGCSSKRNIEQKKISKEIQQKMRSIATILPQKGPWAGDKRLYGVISMAGLCCSPAEWILLFFVAPEALHSSCVLFTRKFRYAKLLGC